MLEKLIALLFGCSHKRTTFPMSAHKHHGTRTYIVCLDCGKEIPYDWENMRAGEPACSTASTQAYAGRNI